MYKIIFLLSSLWTICPLVSYANTNPEDTLPRDVVPLINSTNKIEVEVKTKELDSDTRKILNRTVLIKSFKLNGISAIPESEVREILDPEVGKILSVKEIIELTKSITRIYINKGYALSYAYLPNQPFPTNDIVINFNEGYVGQLVLEGDYNEVHEKIRAIVAPILNERPLTKKTLERQNGMLTLLTGAAIKSSLPIPKQGHQATSLAIVADKRKHAFSTNFESINPRARAVVAFRSASQTSSAEQFSFSTLLSAQDEEYYALSYTQLLGTTGLGLRVDGSMYDGDSLFPGSQDLKRNAFSLRLSTSLTYPLVISKTKSLIVTGGVSANNFEDKIFSGSSLRNLTQKTNSRSVNLGLNYSMIEANQSAKLSLLLTKGLDEFGASKNTTLNFSTASLENNDDLDFIKINLNLQHNIIFDNKIGTSVSVSAQHSNNRLPVVEKTQFGGYQYGRAFAPGFIFGDSGYGIALELNKLYPLFYKISSLNVIAVQPYILYESAKTFSNFDSIPNASSNSFAIGTRFKTENAGIVDVSVAKPISSRSLNVNEQNDIRFSLNYGLILN